MSKEKISFEMVDPPKELMHYQNALERRVGFEIGFHINAVADVWYSAYALKGSLPYRYQAFFVGLRNGNELVHGTIQLRKSRRFIVAGPDVWNGEAVVCLSQSDDPQAAIRDLANGNGKWIKFHERESDKQSGSVAYHFRRLGGIIGRVKGEELEVPTKSKVTRHEKTAEELANIQAVLDKEREIRNNGGPDLPSAMRELDEIKSEG